MHVHASILKCSEKHLSSYFALNKIKMETVFPHCASSNGWELRRKRKRKKNGVQKRRLSSCQKKKAVQNTFCLPVGRILLASHFDQWESTFPPFKCLSQCKIQTAERLYLHINRSSQRAGLAFLTASPNGTVLLLQLCEGYFQHESGLDRRRRGRACALTHTCIQTQTSIHIYTTSLLQHNCYNSQTLESLYSMSYALVHTLTSSWKTSHALSPACM